MRLCNLPFYGIVYRTVMRVAHRFNWHYAPPSYPDGDTMLWCHWCGFRDVVKRAGYRPAIMTAAQEQIESSHPKF